MAVGISFEIAAMAIASFSAIYSQRMRSVIRWNAAFLVVYILGYLCSIFPNQILISFAGSFIVYRRVIPILMFASNFVLSTRLGELAYALQSFKLSPKLIVAICVAFRFFPTMKYECIAIKDAMRSRAKSFDAKAFINHPVKTFEMFYIPLIAHLGIIADELGNSITVRGGETTQKRTSFIAMNINVLDISFLLMGVLLLLTSLMSRVGVVAW